MNKKISARERRLNRDAVQKFMENTFLEISFGKTKIIHTSLAHEFWSNQLVNPCKKQHVAAISQPAILTIEFPDDLR